MLCIKHEVRTLAVLLIDHLQIIRGQCGFMLSQLSNTFFDSHWCHLVNYTIGLSTLKVLKCTLVYWRDQELMSS